MGLAAFGPDASAVAARDGCAGVAVSVGAAAGAGAGAGADFGAYGAESALAADVDACDGDAAWTEVGVKVAGATAPGTGKADGTC